MKKIVNSGQDYRNIKQSEAFRPKNRLNMENSKIKNNDRLSLNRSYLWLPTTKQISH